MIESLVNKFRRKKKEEQKPPTEEERIDALIARANERFVLLSQTKQEESVTYGRSSTADLANMQDETVLRAATSTLLISE